MAKLNTGLVLDVSHELINYQAFPVFQLVNDGIAWLKEGMNDGERGYSFSKVGSYLGFRLVSYSLIPLASNMISTLFCALLSLVTLPTRSCCDANQWCWIHLQGSVYHTGQSLWDLTCDVRQVAGLLGFCEPDSPYLVI